MINFSSFLAIIGDIISKLQAPKITILHRKHGQIRWAQNAGTDLFHLKLNNDKKFYWQEIQNSASTPKCSNRKWIY